MDLFPNTNPSYEDVLFYPISVQDQATHLRNLIETVAQSKMVYVYFIGTKHGYQLNILIGKIV